MVKAFSKGIEIFLIPCLGDNQNYAIVGRESSQNIGFTVDSPDPQVITKFFESKNWNLDVILNTHHHWDHVDGNPQLKNRWNCKIYGPEYEEKRIKKIDFSLNESSTYQLGKHKFEIIHLPGHTLGHIAYYSETLGVLFVGDTLFSAGCGRLFEGTPDQMWESLKKLRTLPDETLVFCAHEYTLNNIEFALSLEPNRQSLLNFQNVSQEKRSKSLPTVPTTIGVEKEINPFLRADDIELKKNLNMTENSDVEIFAHIRKSKDTF